MKLKRALIACIILFVPFHLYAQYWGERVLEKGFEESDFFFTPGYVIPYGIGPFKATTPGLLDDPLSNLAVNPARVRLDSARSTYIYADFRNARTIHDPNNFVVPWVAYAAADVAYRPYPYVYLNSRRVLEPVFSGALIGRPLPEKLPDLIAGASYQLMLQDSKYYNVPQDIYRSVIGTDFAGRDAAAASSIPIVDRFSGQDDMHQKGHFMSAFAQYDISSVATFGARVGRVTFDRSGGYGSTNLWGYPVQSSSTSLWSNLESREQSYDHWELTGGIEIRSDAHTSLGVTGGWLWGDATQTKLNADSSYYRYTYNTTDQSYYLRSGNTDEIWKNKGGTLLLGGDLTSRLSPTHTLRLVYQHQGSTIDLGVGSAIVDTSYSFYSYSGSTPPYMSTSYSRLRDVRDGGGKKKGWSNRILASVQWKLSERADLSIGAQLDWQTTEINTSEHVSLTSLSSYQSNQGGSGVYGSDASKDLLWAFTAEQTSFRIPVFLTIRASDAIQVLLGLNRAMTHYTVEDVTLALFQFRQTNENGTITREENFGERYRQPKEEQSDIRTTFLAGITASPSASLQIRFLVVPNFHDTYDGSELEDLQWWIGMTLSP